MLYIWNSLKICQSTHHKLKIADSHERGKKWFHESVFSGMRYFWVSLIAEKVDNL